MGIPNQARAALLLLLAGLIWLAGQAQANPQEMLDAPTWETEPPGRLLSVNATLGADRPVVRVAPNGQLLVVFNRFTSMAGDKLPDPYYTLSNDNGQSWSTPAPLYQSSGVTSLYTTFTYNSSSVAHAVWVENLSLVYARQGDWPGITRTLSDPDDIPGALHPQIVSSGSSTLDVVWAEGDLADPGAFVPSIRHTRSTNNGSTWTNSTIPTSPYNAGYPSLVVGTGGKLHLAWEDTLLAEYRIYYTEGTSLGNAVSWSEPVLISGDLTTARRPQLLVNGNSVIVTFTRRNDDNVQWIYHTECNGQCLNANSWDTPSIISGQTVGVNSDDPTVLVSSMMRLGACTFVYFHGTQPSAPPPFNENEILWGVNSCDGWGAIRDQVTTTDVRSLYPVLAASSQHVHLVYERAVNSDRQIYYMRAVPPPDINAPVFLPYMAKSQ